MKVFLDTNVVIDLIGCREPFFIDAATIASMAKRGEIEIVVSTISYPTISYILQRYSSAQIAIMKMEQFASFTTIATTTDDMIRNAFHSEISDYEDAVQYETAKAYNCDFIITRNVKDFIASSLPVLYPSQFIEYISERTK